MQGMREGEWRRGNGGAKDKAPGSEDGDEFKWQSEIKGFDKFIAYATKPGTAEKQSIGLVLERSGFASWKLTEVRLPALR